MSELIHPTAIIDPQSEIPEGTIIGPYCIIGPNVKLGQSCKLHSHVILEGHTTIGDNNELYSFCSIGAPPQDLTYKDQPTVVEVGNGNVFREYVSIHRGTIKENQITKVGSDCFLMAHVHLGHDVMVGDNCVIANSVNFAGHVKVGSNVIIGGGTNVSQFVSIGRGSYVGGASGLDRDVPIFCTAYGNRARLKGINIIGLRRQKYSKATISELVDFFRTMESSALSPRAFIDHEELMNDYASNELVAEMANSIRNSEIGLAPFMS